MGGVNPPALRKTRAVVGRRQPLRVTPCYPVSGLGGGCGTGGAMLGPGPPHPAPCREDALSAWVYWLSCWGCFNNI